MTQPLEQIVRRKLSDEVFDRLERMITSGELQPGDEMPSERVLMERFGVGFTGDQGGHAVPCQQRSRQHFAR